MWRPLLQYRRCVQMPLWSPLDALAPQSQPTSAPFQPLRAGHHCFCPCFYFFYLQHFMLDRPHHVFLSFFHSSFLSLFLSLLLIPFSGSSALNLELKTTSHLRTFRPVCQGGKERGRDHLGLICSHHAAMLILIISAMACLFGAISCT